MILKIHYALIPYTKGNFWGWFVTLLINVFEGTPYNHVWFELKSPNKNLAWDISDWTSKFSKVLPVTLLKYYVEDYAAEYEITQQQWDILEKEANNLVGRKYAVVKLLMLTFARIFKLNWVAKLPGVTCTQCVAIILKSINLYKGEPGLAGLVEIDLATIMWNKVF